MKKQNTYAVFLVAILIILIFINSCSSDKEYIPPSKVQSTPLVEEKSPQPTQTIAPETKKQEAPKISIFKVGESTTDNQLKVTVNNIKFISKIDEKNNEFLIAESPSEKQYAIIDLTVENLLPDKTQTVSTFVESQVVDQDGFTYNIDFKGLTALDKSFKDGEILPNMKKRGEIAFLVPISATNLKFIYKFDLLTGTSAIFDIK